MKKLDCNNGAEVFRNNEKLRSLVFSYALEYDAYYQADEILSYFRHYKAGRRYETLKDYEIDYCGAWAKPNTDYLKDFFEDCKTVSEVFGIFDTMQNIDRIFDRIIAKLELYEDAAVGYYDMSEENFERLEAWIMGNANEAASYIADYAQESYEQFGDDDILEDYFLTVWLEGRDDLEVDENGNVFETNPRQIA